MSDRTAKRIQRIQISLTDHRYGNQKENGQKEFYNKLHKKKAEWGLARTAQSETNDDMTALLSSRFRDDYSLLRLCNHALLEQRMTRTAFKP